MEFLGTMVITLPAVLLGEKPSYGITGVLECAILATGMICRGDRVGAILGIELNSASVQSSHPQSFDCLRSLDPPDARIKEFSWRVDKHQQQKARLVLLNVARSSGQHLGDT